MDKDALSCTSIHNFCLPVKAYCTEAGDFLQRAHLRRACLVLVEVEVDDIAHLLPAPVHHPVVPVEGPLPSHQALQARQWAAHTQHHHMPKAHDIGPSHVAATAQHPQMLAAAHKWHNKRTLATCRTQHAAIPELIWPATKAQEARLAAVLRMQRLPVQHPLPGGLIHGCARVPGYSNISSLGRTGADGTHPEHTHTACISLQTALFGVLGNLKQTKASVSS